MLFFFLFLYGGRETFLDAIDGIEFQYQLMVRITQAIKLLCAGDRVHSRVRLLSKETYRIQIEESDADDDVKMERKMDRLIHVCV